MLFRSNQRLNKETIDNKPYGQTDSASDNTIIWSIWRAAPSWYIATWNILSSKLELVLKLPELDHYDLTMSPDGEYIAAYHNEDLGLQTHLIILDGRTGRRLAENRWESAPMATRESITAVQFSADSGMLAVTYSDEKLRNFRRR